MIQCIIFDCDGTLVDSEYLCNLGLEIKLKDYGIVASAETMMKRFRGGRLALILQELEKEHKIKLKEDFVPSYRSLVEKLFDERLEPCEGVPKMIEAIDLPKCVASSGPLEKINKALSVTGLAGHFGDKLFSCYEVGTWKPDPGIFLHAAKAMGFQPNQCVVVEDSPVGISAAKAAGMFSVLYDPDNMHHSITGACKIKHMKQLQSAIT